jgi:hypothetical protein
VSSENGIGHRLLWLYLGSNAVATPWPTQARGCISGRIGWSSRHKQGSTRRVDSCCGCGRLGFDVCAVPEPWQWEGGSLLVSLSKKAISRFLKVHTRSKIHNKPERVSRSSGMRSGDGSRVLQVGLPRAVGCWLDLVVHWPEAMVRQEPTRNPSLRFRRVVRLSFAQPRSPSGQGRALASKYGYPSAYFVPILKYNPLTNSRAINAT